MTAPRRILCGVGAAGVVVLCGCEGIKNSTGIGDARVYVAEVEGHNYVVAEKYSALGIVHAESCPCKYWEKRP